MADDGLKALDIGAVTDRLASVGVPVSEARLADTPQAVERAFDDLGMRRGVVKAGGLLHKSDAAGVVTGLASADAAGSAARDMLERVGPEALPFVVQPEASGLEMLVGLRRAGDLGAIVVVGLGGTQTEVHRDLARRLAPVSEQTALQMLQELRSWPLLTGHRGDPPRDVDALVEVIVGVSQLAASDPGVREVDLNPVMVGVAGDGCVVVDARIIVGDGTDVEQRPAPDLDRMLRPSHVVVVGVSDDEDKMGARLFRYLNDHGYPGRLDAVHPDGGTVRGHRRIERLSDVQGSPDLVCVVVPARFVPEVVRDAAALDAGGVLIHSSDFAESGDDGRRMQEEVVGILREASIPLAGPNSMGIVATKERLAASISGGLESELVAGRTALLTGSGALGSCVATRLMHAGVGLSYWIHAGNEADLVIGDYLRWLVDDPDTSVLGLLLENIRYGTEFVEAGRATVAAGKPVFAYNMVRSEKGRAAAMSHTGAMVGSFEVREEVLRAAGVVSVPTLRVLEDALLLSSANELPRGSRLACVTFSGGACTIVADQALRCGVDLPELSDQTVEAVRQYVPAYAAIRNPLDVSFQMVTQPDAFQRALETLATSGEFDALLVQFTTNADPYAEHTARAVVAVRESVDVPVYVSRFGGEQLAPRALAVYREASIPVLDAPDRAVYAIGAIMEAGANVARHRAERDPRAGQGAQ